MKTFQFTYDNNHMNVKDCIVTIDARTRKSASHKFSFYIHNEVGRYYCPTDITVKKVEEVPSHA